MLLESVLLFSQHLQTQGELVRLVQVSASQLQQHNTEPVLMGMSQKGKHCCFVF
jgi:hypothetical protein